MVWKDHTPIDNARLSRYMTRAANGAQRADLIRLDALSAHGGIYFDSDIRVLRNFEELIKHYDFFIGNEDGCNLTNAVIGAIPHHPALESIIGFLEENEPDWTLPANVTTGPVLFAKLLKWRGDVHILPREMFYPYNWNEPPREVHRLSYTEHLWDGSWEPEKPQEVVGQESPAIRAKALGKRLLRTLLASSFSTLSRVKGASESSAKGFLLKYESRSYPCNEEVIATTAHGQKIVLDGRDLSITPNVVLHGFHEWPEEAFVRRTLRGGDWFIDIGANVGVFSILAASLCGPLGRVFAFEPNPHARRLLSKSAVMNWYHDRIKIFDVALGDTEETAIMTYYPERLGDAQIDADEKESVPFRSTGTFLSEKKHIKVSIRTLDDIFPVDLPIKILKIDAEGHEPKILSGSMRLLKNRAFDFIILEAEIELFAKEWKELLASFRMLIDSGYTAGVLDWDGFLVTYGSLEEALRRRDGRTLIFISAVMQSGRGHMR